MTALTGSKALWFATRGSGASALVLLTVSLILGVVTTQRVASRTWPRFVIEGLHRNVSLGVSVFVVLHIATTVIDAFAPIGWWDALLPFHSPYRRAWLGLGAIAVDLLIAVTVTSLLRARLSYGLWRTVHLFSYACWPIAFIHGLGTGSDASSLWFRVLNAVCLVAVASAVGWRLTVERDEKPNRAKVPGASRAPSTADLVSQDRRS